MNARFRGLGLGLSLLLLTSCGGTPRTSHTTVPADDRPEITQFYSTLPTISAGSHSLLCYSTHAADEVTLTPAHAVVAPSPSRCVEVSPAVTTTYTLRARKGKQEAAPHTVVVHVRAAVAAGPRFAGATLSATLVKPGALVAFCFQATGADSVEGSPGHFQKGGLAAGDCLVDQPSQTTRYSLTLHGQGGTKTENATVTVVP